MFWSRDEPSATIKSGVSDPIDETVLDGLRQDFASRIIRLYLDGTPGVLKELRAAARVGDMSALHTANHNLLSASATLGAVRLAALCHDMDLVLKAADR
jgi:HPt (histidine-containing phosphotransfer) domain-containing protein